MSDNAPADAPAQNQPDASGSAADAGHHRNASWLRAPARDVVLVLLGAALAIGAEEWRDTRQRKARVRAALTGIATELREDSVRVTTARARHLRIVDTLEAYAVRRALPPREVYLYGMFNPASVSSIAWQAARETGAVADMPLPTVLALARVYEAQQHYDELGGALNVGIMEDVRHDGMDVVLRDRFKQFIPIATDFANREGGLLTHYRRALAMLGERR